MPVRNIECQLAQGQLNRYMGGDGLSESALEQLEAHIRECEDCGIYLDEKKRALQAMIEPQVEKSAPVKPTNIPTHAVVMLPDDEPKPANTFMATLAKKRAALDQAVRPATANVETANAIPTPNSFIKPLLYSLGLAAILIGMSALMRDPTRLLGDRVAKTNPEAAIATPPEKKSETPAKSEITSPTTVASNSTSNEKEKSALAPNPTVEAEARDPKPETRNPKPETRDPKTTNSIKAPAKPRSTTTNRTTRRNPVVARRSAPRKSNLVAKSTSPKPKARGIKVYDDNGTQISE